MIFFRNKYARFLRQLFQLIISYPLFLFGAVVPKSKRIWVFGHAFGYKDNPKYLYEYQLKDPSVRAVWISREKRPYGIKGEWYYYLSMRGIWIQYRAGVACVGTGGGDIARFPHARTFIVQLWHGIPIKKLLLDSPETFPFPSKFTLLNQMFSRCLKSYLRKYNLLVAVNEHNRECLSRAFGLDKGNIVITGMPRHDIILETSRNLERKGARILCAPTWRSSIVEAEKWIRKILSQTSIEFYRANDIYVDVSIHPLNQQLNAIVEADEEVNLYRGDDINKDLSSYDVLVTDYSSVALDFSLLKRPVVFMCENIAKYAKERGVYEYFLDIIRCDHVEDESGLIAKLSLVLFKDCSCRRGLYEVVADGNARKRIVDEIKRNT